MQLITRRESTSFYESFSDLIFCTLVLFIILVMILSLSVNEQVESYAEEQQAITEKLEAQKNELAALEAQAARKQQELRGLLGETRFTAYFGSTNFNIICDVISDPPRYWPVPATYYHEVTTNHLNETEDDKNIRIRNINQKVQDLIQTNRSYSAEELGLLVRSFSMYTTGELDKRSKKIGIIFNQTESGLIIDQVFSPSSAEKAHLIRGELITHINGISLKQDGRKILIDKINKTRDQDSVRLSVVSPDKSTREVMCYPEYGEKINAVYEITYGSFNLIASGLLGVDGKIKDTADILKSIQSNPQDDSLRLTDAELVKLIDEVKNSLQIYSEMANRVDAGRYRPSHIGSLPELNIYVSKEEESGLIAGMRLTADEILQLVRAIGGRGAVLNWIVKDNAPIPEWVKQKVLEPSGFRDKAPLN